MESSSYWGGESVEKSSLRRSVENYDGKGSSSSVSSREIRSTTNYDGKGSSTSTTSEKKSSSLRRRTSMSQLLQLLEEFEACREDVEVKRAELGQAQRKLNDKEKEISRKLSEFDPEIRNKFYAMMGALKDKGEER